jgi:endonuclease YncB( thermonuclease family)
MRFLVLFVLFVAANRAVGFTAEGHSAHKKEEWDAVGLMVLDGNTLEVSRDGHIYRLLLAHIGAPVRGQPFAKEAKNALKELVYGQKLHVVIEKEDRLGRLIAQVTVGHLLVNAEMVKKGLAWVYRRYTDDKNLLAVEENARKQKIGLWQEENPVAPWVYRQYQREQRRKERARVNVIDKKGSAQSVGT